MDALHRFGVLDAVLAAGPAELEKVVMEIDDVRIEAIGDERIGERAAMCVRRVTLDALLVEAAAEAGVDVRTGTRVTGMAPAAWQPA